MYWVYILQSEKDNSFYIGQTSSIEGRLLEHNQGISRYTSRKIPWKIVYTEEYSSRKEAMQREQFLKKQRNRDFYNRLIASRNK
ncbi:MAG TPA: GIY-YIG nuclease family protein [Brumimicrobium sp.]|nr:GIY-YIG nuclease family protein [Brumimicrobium sp.]